MISVNQRATETLRTDDCTNPFFSSWMAHWSDAGAHAIGVRELTVNLAFMQGWKSSNALMVELQYA